MVKYYYDKYSTKKEYKEIITAAHETELDELQIPVKFALLPVKYYESYSFSKVTGLSVGGVVKEVTATTQNPPIGYYYKSKFNEKYVYQIREDNWIIPNGRVYAKVNRAEARQIDVKGDLIETIQAEDSAYPADGLHTDGFWYVKKGLANTPPTVKLTMASSSQTLYESDSYGITGTAQDADAGDVVMVKYKINNSTARTIASPVSTGAEFPFNKFLTFKEGKLFDGSVAVTGALAEGTQHALTVWAEDDKGGKSAEVSRTFYVIPNRPPKLTVEPITPKTDMIDTDSFEIKGTVNNPDANGVKVHYKIGNSAYQEVYSSAGAGGAFSFRLSLSQLANGANSLTIRATDAFGAVDTKTITITKAGTSLPLKTAVTRYKLIPANGTAKGVLMWVERETGDLTIDAEISMTVAGEPESYQPMNRTATAFVRDGIEEDEFTFDAVTDKTEIILKITMTRTSTASNKGITLISGVFS